MQIRALLRVRCNPTHRLYRVTGEGDKTSWTPIGAAWVHRDGNGYSINLDAVPLTGRIVMRVIEAKADATEGELE